MRKICKKFVIVLSVFTLLTSGIIVNANNGVDTINLKKQLVEKAPEVKITDEKEKDKFEETVRNEFQETFGKYGYDQNKIDDFFKSKGYIKFDAKKASTYGISSLFTNTAYASTAPNVTMNSPSIYYSTSTGRWTVSGGGYWNNCTWANDRKSIFGIYQNGNMGGNDVMGIYFSNLKNSSGVQTAVKSQELYTRSYNGTSMVSSTSRLNQSSQNGVFFSYQDYTYNDSQNDMTNYNLDGFAVLLQFDSTFESVHGVASSGYEHTWNETGAVGITLSNSGWTATLNGSSTYSWPAYSYDTAY